MSMALLDLARANAPALASVIPLCAAAFIALVPNARAGWLVAVAASLAGLAVTGDLAARALLAHAALGFDGVGVFAAPLMASGVFLTSLASGALMTKECGAKAAPLGFALVLCAGAGWIGAALARDLFGMVLGVELGWLAGVALLGASGHGARGALAAALRMLGAGAVGAALLILGAALMSRGAGAELAAIGEAGAASQGALGVGFALAIAGLAVKAGAAPLNAWMGPAYGRGGVVVLLCLGAVGSIGALAAIGRLSAHVLFNPFVAEGASIGVAALGAASVLVGSIQAIGANNLGRLIAHAGAAQAGCYLLCVALASRSGYGAGLIQLVACAAATLGLVAALAAVGARAPLAQMDGLFQRAPLASAAIGAAALCLMGAPLTIGFLARWRLMEAGVGAGSWLAAGAALAASIAGVIYGGRLLERAYFRRAAAPAQGAARAAALTPAMVAAIATIALGLAPSLVQRAADAAADLALGAPP